MIRTWVKARWHSFAKRRLLVVCFLVSGLLQLGGVIYMAYNDIIPSPRYDATEYRVLAQNILKHRVFSTSPTSPYLPELLRTPGYPLALAATYLLEPSGYLMLFLHILFRLAVGWMIYDVGRHLLRANYWLLLAATSVWLFDLYTIFIGFQTFSDTYFAFLLCLSVYLALFSSEKDSFGRIMASPFLLGFAILTRPQGIVFAPLLLGIFFIQGTRSYKRLALLIFTLTIIPGIWMMRNIVHTQHAVLSSSGEYNLTLGVNWAGDASYYQHLIRINRSRFIPAVDLGDGKEPFRNHWIYTTQGYPTLHATFQEMVHAYGWPKLAWIQLKTLPTIWYPTAQQAIFGSFPYPPVIQYTLHAIDLVTILFLLLGICSGCIFALNYKKYVRHSLLILVLLSGIFLGTWSNAGNTIQRLRTPVLPFALIISLFGLQHLIGWVRSLLREASLTTPAQTESEDSKTTTLS